MSWWPTASKKNLIQRAEYLEKIRHFFKTRQVLEVETPVAVRHGVTDPHLTSFEVPFLGFLQTSPEYHMKRLLAADVGDIFQICKCFRQDEQGLLHNQEFTLLEWYRLGYTQAELICEVDELLQFLLNTPKASVLSYQEIFLTTLGCDPLLASEEELNALCQQYSIDWVGTPPHRDSMLQLLFNYCIEPQLKTPTFVYDFPVSQAALAMASKEDPRVAHRFELYAQGIELANGFQELLDPEEQRQRFMRDNEQRRQLKLPARELDEHFLAALAHGLPSCSGVALGIDRLMMIALQGSSIEEVLSFRD